MERAADRISRMDLMRQESLSSGRRICLWADLQPAIPMQRRSMPRQHARAYLNRLPSARRTASKSAVVIELGKMATSCATNSPNEFRARIRRQQKPSDRRGCSCPAGACVAESDGGDPSVDFGGLGAPWARSRGALPLSDIPIGVAADARARRHCDDSVGMGDSSAQRREIALHEVRNAEQRHLRTVGKRYGCRNFGDSGFQPAAWRTRKSSARARPTE